MRSLLAGVLVIAIACAAVAYPSRWWASGLLSSALLLLALAALGAVLSRGAGRAALIGFAWLGGVYLICAYAPWFDQHVAPQLPTTQLARAWFDHFERPITPTVAGAASVDCIGFDEKETHWRVTFADGSSYQIIQRIGAPSRQSLEAIVHSLAAFLLAMLGAFSGRWFYENTPRDGTRVSRSSDSNP